MINFAALRAQYATLFAKGADIRANFDIAEARAASGRPL
jgi:hypothetical protein